MKKYAEASWMGWLWRSAEMRRIMHEHKLHHDGLNHNRYFSMIPFDCFFIYPLWPEEHMRPTMLATINGIWKPITSQVSLACEKCWCSLKLSALLGMHGRIFYLSPQFWSVTGFAYKGGNIIK